MTTHSETRDFQVTVSNISKSFDSLGSRRVLESLSLNIGKGEFVSITGRSGSGKTTLLNIIGLIDYPNSGEVAIRGINTLELRGNALADFRRKNIGYVFQSNYFLAELTVRENIALPLLPYKDALPFDLFERAKDLLEKVGLKERLNHLPDQLSGGEKQRATLARALINLPAVILADEPTGNLDREMGHNIARLFQDMQRTYETTIILVTHDRQIADYADRKLILENGKLMSEQER